MSASGSARVEILASSFLVSKKGVTLTLELQMLLVIRLIYINRYSVVPGDVLHFTDERSY